jgi:DNA mismatch repair protein MutS2
LKSRFQFFDMNPKLYPADFFTLSDLDKVLIVISSLCSSVPGKALALQPVFFTKAAHIRKEHEPVQEGILLSQSGIILPAPQCESTQTYLENLRTPGWVIDPENLQKFRVMMSSVNQLHRFVDANKQAQHIAKIVRSVVFHEHLLKKCQLILDDAGEIRDDASAELLTLKKSHVQIERDVEKRMASIFRQLKASGLTTDDAAMTVRNGRNVIPVPASSKYKIKGIIHDESATGQTAYVEPMEIVELGNRLRDNMSAQQREIRRILAEVSEMIHHEIEDIFKYPDIIALIDFVFARTRFAMKYKACLPAVKDEPVIQWKDARNIVLQMHLEKQGKTVIPLTIHLNSDNRIVILSGANAGGKSVVLKTVALIQAMIQTALPVPFSDISDAGVFGSLFIDIGDGQSIESDLSTYSSHLETMKVLLDGAKPGLLFLIDEIGSGTDPILGGALAQAMLTELHNKGSMGVVTTHLDVLKKMADSTPGMLNAAMVFDTEKLQPSFQLRAGIPGNSFTFEIAARTGIPSIIIDLAKHLAGDERITFEQRISDVDKRAAELNESLQKQKMAEDFLNELIEKYTSIIQSVDSKQQEIVEQTKTQASELLKTANKTIENTIRQIKESAADKGKTQKARAELKTMEEKVQSFQPEVKIPDKVKKKIPLAQKPQKKNTPIEKVFPGMIVKHTETGMEGEIIEMISPNRVKVAFTSVAMTLSTEMLMPAETQRKEAKQQMTMKGDISRKTGDFDRQLDLRGIKAEEVMYILEKHIDDALLIGIYDFSVLHGKGYGVLRNVVRQILAKHPNVESFESEHIERGGDGITLVRLNR